VTVAGLRHVPPISMSKKKGFLTTDGHRLTQIWEVEGELQDGIVTWLQN
jgi:hypothetical protein